MALFSKPQVIIYPQKEFTQVYFNRSENNHWQLDQQLFSDLQESQLNPLIEFFKDSNHSVTLLLPDDVVATKSFVYEKKIDSITKEELQELAQNQVTFSLDPKYLDSKLDQHLPDKTIIRAQIGHPGKLNSLFQNISKLGLTVEKVVTVSESIATTLGTIFNGEYFLIYPEDKLDSLIMLSSDSQVYLTAKIKGTTPSIQKIINYSTLYFDHKITTLYLPQDSAIKVETNPPMVITNYSSSQMAADLKLPLVFPLPVLGIFLQKTTSQPKTNPVIINQSVSKPPMENKKSLLPIILVFIGTALIASAILWFIINRNSSSDITNPSANISPTQSPADQITPTTAPTPTLAEVSKVLKLQVLNATDINGQAAKVKQELVALKFTSVTVGNSSLTATKNELRFKPSVASASAYFQQNLTGFADATISELATTATYDVVVVIGENLATSSATPTTSP